MLVFFHLVILSLCNLRIRITTLVSSNYFMTCNVSQSSQVVIGAIMAVIVWWLDLQLPMESVHITIEVVSSNLDQGEVYNIMWQSLSVTLDRSMVFSGPPVSSTNKTDSHDITGIFLKVALNTIKQVISIIGLKYLCIAIVDDLTLRFLTIFSCMH